MPRFFFDLASPGGLERDDLGVTFAGVEAAYMEACRAALEISMDMLRARQDPGRHRFEVRDERAALVLEIPFTEVLEPQRRPATPHRIHRQIEATMGRSRQLRAEVRAELVRARGSLETAQATLQRQRPRSMNVFG